MRLVIGAAGGTKITSGVALGMILNLWYDYNVKEAIDAFRIHHQVSRKYQEVQAVIIKMSIHIIIHNCI